MTKKSDFHFVVYYNKEPKMSTNYRECVPELRTLLIMKKFGYTFKVNGKNYVPKKGDNTIGKD